MAFRRLDEAGVFNLGSDQDDVAAALGADTALVLDAAGTRRVVKFVAPGKEIGILELQRGNEQAGDIDLGAFAEQHTVGVDEQDAAITLQLPEDDAGVDADHTVEHLAAGALLQEAHDFVAVDAERLPVDDGARRVGDGQRVAVLLKAGLAGDHRGCLWRRGNPAGKTRRNSGD